MKAVFLRGGVSVADAPDPVPAPGEALIRVTLAGICGTDVELAKGYMDFDGIPGHEFVGVVEEVAGSAEERARWAGQRVAGEINLACGSCEWCGQGLGRHCPSRTVLGILGRDGAHAERLTLPLRNLHPVPDTVSDRDAVFIEPLAAACEILEQVPIAGQERILVVGDGRLGQLVARLLRTVAPDVTVLGRHPDKLGRLAALGIATSSDGTTLAPGFGVAVDATGSPSGLYAAARLLRPRGTLVLKSTYQGERPLPIARIVIDEISIVGSRCGRFEAAIPLLESRAVGVADLVSEVFPLVEAPEAYRRSSASGVLKVLLSPSTP
jgi:threonine dehydrogenase-like Zn-dependent dehydrogenase